MLPNFHQNCTNFHTFPQISDNLIQPKMLLRNVQQLGLSEKRATVCGFVLSAAKCATVLLLLSQARCNVLSPFSELVLILQNLVNFDQNLAKIEFWSPWGPLASPRRRPESRICCFVVRTPPLIWSPRGPNRGGGFLQRSLVYPV